MRDEKWEELERDGGGHGDRDGKREKEGEEKWVMTHTDKSKKVHEEQEREGN